jgi:hypothetical protein
MLMLSDYGMYLYLEIYVVSTATVENFICMLDVVLLRRSVYFLNICYIRMFYCFNRNRALQGELHSGSIPCFTFLRLF